MVVGGLVGAICFVGLSLLLHRRLFDVRVRQTSTYMDLAVLIILGAAFAVGALVLGVTAWNDSRRPPAAEEVENPWDALQQWQVMQWSWDDLTPGAQETICQTYRSEPEKVWAVWDDTGNADGWVTRRQFEDFYGRKCS